MIMDYISIPVSSARILWYPARITHILQPTSHMRRWSLYGAHLRETLASMTRQVSSDNQELCGRSLDRGLVIALRRDAKRLL